MSGLEKSLFNLKFTAKSLNRQAAKAAKDEQKEKDKVKKAIQQGNTDIAKLYAQNAIRKQSERMSLLRLASRIDAVASRVQTAVTMRNVSANMAGVVRNMDRAMESMNLEKMSMVMEKFEQQFEDLDVTTSYYEDAGQVSNAVAAPGEEVDELMSKIADEAGLEMQQKMESSATPATRVKAGPTEVEEDSLGERLRALRA
ncbi:Snf7 family [Lipomyces oligophaga]|uniref:Snf7 family n=1 Tax=Lipomyces oligophaga TaxID=45792 RepID=UPI0034CEB3EA